MVELDVVRSTTGKRGVSVAYLVAYPGCQSLWNDIEAKLTVPGIYSRSGSKIFITTLKVMM